jgi:hydrogenase maturation protein HypF
MLLAESHAGLFEFPERTPCDANNHPGSSRAGRLRLAVRGVVQGVGFRPFVHRLATELRLKGWVNNSPGGVCIEVEGTGTVLQRFLHLLGAEKPPRSVIRSIETHWLPVMGYEGFEIRLSETAGKKSTLVLPDMATCPDCLQEIFDPANRRFRYPFTNCTNCGPRFSIIESIPYDRANTSMKAFKMCPECKAEYEDPRNRRFHAQPNACPVCGPQLELWNTKGEVLGGGEEALHEAADAIRCGRIVALKGLGGFQLLVAADHNAAILRLRQRKHRKEKPFALMFPSMKSIAAVCELSSLEQMLLNSPEAPIVLLRKLDGVTLQIADSVSPDNPYLGAMLPCTPLHHLLMNDLAFPVVATSGNRRDEPICISEEEALERMSGIADVFLVHNRPIVRHVDDSIVRVMAGREMMVRRARGYAPLPVPARSADSDRPVLAVGAHLKNAVAISTGDNIFISQHIGDLETEQAFDAFQRIASDFESLYEVTPQAVVTDMHPDYLSTQFAEEQARRKGLGFAAIQHHVAHVLSCMTDNGIEPPALGVAWDGTGWGPGGEIWGGEFFKVTDNSVGRFAHLRPFRLPGGDTAIREPRRIAAAMLHEVYGEKGLSLLPANTFSEKELDVIQTMLRRGLNAPLCCSMGRLFDAVASLIGLRQRVEFEGQAAMDMEFALQHVQTRESYSIQIRQDATAAQQDCELITGYGARNSHSPYVLDWSPLLAEILSDLRRRMPVGEISARFHNTLAEAIVTMAIKSEQRRVALSGGCFQNRYLTERTITRLREEGFQPYWHRHVPPNDGGIALGQVAAAHRFNL